MSDEVRKKGNRWKWILQGSYIVIEPLQQHDEVWTGKTVLDYKNIPAGSQVKYLNRDKVNFEDGLHVITYYEIVCIYKLEKSIEEPEKDKPFSFKGLIESI